MASWTTADIGSDLHISSTITSGHAPSIETDHLLTTQTADSKAWTCRICDFLVWSCLKYVYIFHFVKCLQNRHCYSAWKKSAKFSKNHHVWLRSLLHIRISWDWKVTEIPRLCLCISQCAYFAHTSKCLRSIFARILPSFIAEASVSSDPANSTNRESYLVWVHNCIYFQHTKTYEISWMWSLSVERLVKRL